MPLPESPHPLRPTFMSSGPFAIGVPQLFFNGFMMGHSATEINCILMSNNQQPVTSLVMTPEVAKSYGNALLDIVRRYEKATKRKIHTLEELTKRVSENTAAQDSEP